MSADHHELEKLHTNEPRINADLFLVALAAEAEQQELPLDEPIPEDEPELPGIPPR